MSEVSIRQKQITKTSLTGVIINIFLSGFKAFVGFFLAHSIAVLLDAVNNLTDALSSVITIVGIRLAKRNPDNAHPFGHGRIEYFSAVLIAGIILAAGVTSMVESVKKIIHPELPVFDLLSVIIISVAIVAKLILGRYTSSQGKKYNSEALIASGADARFDAIISASTLLGIIITLLFGITLDGWIGAVIALFILKAGFELLGESLSSILGNRPDSETTKAIKATVCEIDGVLGAYDLVLHDYGPDSALGSIHVEISSTMSAEDIHRLTKHIQLAVKDKYHVFLTVGIYAVDETHVKQREEIKRFAMEYDGVLGTHGVFIDDTMKYISFDVLTDFTVNRDQLQNDLKNHISTLLPGYKVDINFDSNYSD